MNGFNFFDSDDYKFVITNGAVTGIESVHGTHTHDLRVPDNATFTIGATTITETLTGTSVTKVISYVQDASDATIYHIGSETTTVATPTTTYGTDHVFGYAFTIVNGAVTAAQVTEGSGTSTHSHTLRTDATTTFSVSASGAVTETSVHDNVVETTTYVAVGTTGLYAVSANSETFIQSGAATTLLDLEPHDRLEFTISATSVVSDPLQVKSDGTTKAVTASASTTYTLLEAGYVLEVHTRGGHSSYEVYHDGNGDGIYTEVAHGSGATVDLVGLKAQITTGIDAVL